jgi:hypothetical protein
MILRAVNKAGKSARLQKLKNFNYQIVETLNQLAAEVRERVAWQTLGKVVSRADSQCLQAQ